MIIRESTRLASEPRTASVPRRWPEFEYGNPGSFRKGLSTLPNAIAKELGDQAKLQWELTSVEKSNKGYKATFSTPDGVKIVDCRSLVSTLPAHKLGGDVLKNVLPAALPLVEEVRNNIKRKGVYYPPVCACTVAYSKSAFRDIELDNGFGNLRDP